MKGSQFLSFKHRIALKLLADVLLFSLFKAV